MAKYHLVHIDSKGTFFNLTRLEMVNKLKQVSDLQNWFCWYPGITQWKQASQAHEVREWMAHPWTDDQAMPDWQDLFTKRARGETQNFEVVEFNENSTLNPPTPPIDPKSEFAVAGFSGQVFDFDESLKDKHMNTPGFKIINQDNKNVDEATRFENTTKINLVEHVVNDNNTGKIEAISDMTITKEVQLIDKDTQAPTAGKKHNRRYPRIKGRLRTIITNKAKAFMTFTKDISLGGIQVENNIPQDILNSEIEVYVSDPSGKKSILFRCHPVGDMKNPCRFSFAKADEKNLQKLSQWIDDLAKINVA